MKNKITPIHAFAAFLWINLFFMIWGFLLDIIALNTKAVIIAILILIIALIASAAASPKE